MKKASLLYVATVLLATAVYAAPEPLLGTWRLDSQEVNGQLLSAIQLTTASGICAMVDMLVNGQLPQTGLVRQEQATLADFLMNRFGQYYGAQLHLISAKTEQKVKAIHG